MVRKFKNIKLCGYPENMSLSLGYVYFMCTYSHINNIISKYIMYSVFRAKFYCSNMIKISLH